MQLLRPHAEKGVGPARSGREAVLMSPNAAEAALQRRRGEAAPAAAALPPARGPVAS
jgi:hypothetical protein